MTENELAELVDRMTLEEQVLILSGQDVWSTAPIPRLGIGSLRMTDGPSGARGGGSLIAGVKTATFPVGIALGATWNTALLGEIGAAIAEQTLAKGARMLLGPTVNIHRSVTNGRNFECYSEDPVLTAHLASAYIKGMQSRGVAATIKHFAGNESEIERTTVNSEIDERALREIYLLPFEVAVKDAGTWGVMSSYNKLNGTYSAENTWLLTKVLREDWGYDGIVMSDWFGSRTTAPTVNAGLNLEMPGPTRDRGDKLIDAVETGQVSRAKVRELALDMLRLMDRNGALREYAAWEEKELDLPAHRALIRRAGAEAAVLLKNDGALLPLDATLLGSVAVIGPNAKVAQIMGGGSARTNPYYRVSPWDGLVARLGADRLSYAEGCGNGRFVPLYDGTFEMEWYDNQTLDGAPVATDRQDRGEVFLLGEKAGGKVDPYKFSLRLKGSYTPAVSGTYEIGLAAAGYARAYLDGELVADATTNWTVGRTFFEEGCEEVVSSVSLDAGRTYEITVELVSKQPRNLHISAVRLGIGLSNDDALIAEAVAAARAADVALVFVGRSGEWDTEGSDLLNIDLPGRQNDLVSAVVAANPKTIVVLQTGGPVEMPWIETVPSVLEAWYPGMEAGNAIADVLFGSAEPGGRLPQSFPVRWQDNPTQSQDPEVYPGIDGKVRYEEGVFIGYRHYDRTGIAPLFPFGHGLGYTDFALTGLMPHATAFDTEGKLAVDIVLENTGKREGAAVVQLYICDVEANVPRPEKELKSFAKVTLAPGEKRTVTLTLTPRDFAFFDVASQCWRVEPGRFDLIAGFSATDIRARTEITLDEGMELPV